MAIRRFQRSIRFSKEEWNSVVKAAERCEMLPGSYARAAATRAAADDRDLNDHQLTPELIELTKRTFRGVHLLAHLKREQLVQLGREDDLMRAAEAAKAAQSETCLSLKVIRR